MLSKKMTVSLMSLITILALAFVVPSATAQDFDATFSAMDVSFAADTQLEAGASVVIYLTFGQVVDGGDVITPATPAAKLFGINAATDGTGGGVVNIYNKFGASIDDATAHTITVAARDLDPGTGVRNDGKSFMITIAGLAATTDDNTNPVKVELFLAEGKINNANPNEDKKNKKGGPFIVNLVGADPTGESGTPAIPNTRPRPVSIALANNLLVPADGFTGESFQIIVTLSEMTKENKFTKDHLTVDKGTAADGVHLGAMDPDEDNDGTADTADGGDDGYTSTVIETGRDRMHQQYLVTITPKAEDGDLVIKLNAFEDQNMPTPNMYTPVTNDLARTPGVDQLTVKIKKASAAKALAAGHEVKLKNKRVIPAGGYLIVATATADTGINLPDAADADDNTPKIDKRSPAELKYNAISVAIPNLEAFLGNGGTIDLVSPDAGLMISEIMWGSDASLATNSNSQWIEIKNTTAADIKTGDGTHKLIFYGPNEAAPAKVAVAAVAETATTKAQAAGMALPAGIVDRVGTIDDKGGYWSLAGKGQSGRTGYGETKTDLTAIVPTLELISMYRVTKADATGAMPLGNTSAAWMQSTPPAVNMDPAKGGNRIASPGAEEIETAAEKAAREAAEKAKSDAATAAAAKAADTSVMMPKVGQIYISEIMFAGGGTLPQWIEISNGSRTEEVNLSGWTLTVDNAIADADVSVGASIKFTIPEGTKIDPSGQNDSPSTILVVTETGRNNLTGADAAGQVLNLFESQQTELILGGVTKRRYSLLSSMAFQITLAPPVPIVVPAAKTAAPTTAAEIAAARAAAADKKAADAKAAAERAAATDMVGNLGADGAATWALPMSEDGGRSSIIRRHVPVSIGPAEPEDGSMMDSWALASDTSFAQVTHIRAASYYGAANDVGTPGFRAGGALPVELSHFRPARNKETGQVVITWSTQSELNNAGFFIKRSQQKDGEFKVINATMIPGAGTTSEKQFYTYTDTTAQPNVVYYYQIEDVSLDGNRQTLTRGIRLKGHIGAAGKLTSTWGEIKTSNE